MNFILLFILPSIVLSGCGKGCLKCDKHDNCLICNVLQSFVLQNNSCNQIQHNNCFYLDIGGNCLRCNPGYFSSPITKKCVQIDQENLLENCKFYDSSQNCQVCQMGYYLSQAKCQQIENQIENCQIYLTQNFCSECNQGYFKSIDGRQCIQQSIKNCINYSPLQCKECQQDFILNENYYLDYNIKFNTQNEQRNVLQQIFDHKFGNNKLIHTQTCQRIQVTNCQQYITYNLCEICQENFYLDEKFQCQKYPNEQIPYCVQYQSMTNCIECQQGYYIQNKRCIKISEIQNCEIYNTKSSTVQCLRCQQGYYINNEICQQRVKSLGQLIQNCKEKNIYQDNCLKCDMNYVLTNDGFKCLIMINNCKYYTNISSQSKENICQQCDDKYYLKDNQCELGMIENCLIYEHESKCKKCINQYNLDINNQCKSIKEIQNCQEYVTDDIQKKNSCKKCKEYYYNFNIKDYCINISPVPNCIQYRQDFNNPLCEKCLKGFYLDNNNQCQRFNDSNCSQGDTQDDCTGCMNGYTLNDIIEGQKKCILPKEYQTQNCLTTNIDQDIITTIDSVECNVCKNGYYPININQSFICVNKILYFDIEIKKENKLIDNCIKYTNQGDCLLCQHTYYIYKDSNDITQCVKQCPEQYSLLIYKLDIQNNQFQLSTANECIKDDSNSCQIKGYKVYDLYDNIGPSLVDSNLICIQCKDNYIQVIDDLFINEYSNANIKSQGLQDLVMNQYQRNVKVQCIQSESINDVQQQPIENCQYYYESNNIYYCIKCNQGYHGIVKNSVVNYIMSCQPMNDCDVQQQIFGLHNSFGNFISCTKCLDQNKIPFIGLDINNQPNEYTIQGLKAYDLLDIDYQNFIEEDYNIQCLDSSQPSQFGNDSTKFNQFPNFCGLGIININTNDGLVTHNKSQINDLNQDLKLAIFCGSCQPGYRPIYLNENRKFIVTQCIPIENCQIENQNIFNHCTLCQEGYVFEYNNNSNTNNIINYQKCIQNSTQNCQSAEPNIDIDTEGKCLICIKGYYLNKDYQCEQIQSPKCISYYQSNFYIQNLKKNILNLLTFYQAQGNGCNECIQGYVSVQKIQDQYVCMQSNYIIQKKQFKNLTANLITQYINNCDNYFYKNGNVLCSECIENFILNKSQTKCLTLINNCVQISDTDDTKCLICQDGYALIQGQCQKGNIINCQQYYTQISKNQIECKQCSIGYYLDSLNDFCKKGKVQNCKYYIKDSDIQCEICQEGFSKIKNEIDICYRIDERLNCNQSNIDVNNISCLSLTQDMVNQNNDTNTICMQHNIIDNCIEYDVQDEIGQSTFQCLECNVQYYLKDYQCIKRINILDTCQVYDKYQDKCTQCIPQYFLSDNQVQCIEFPQGIIGCKVYKTKDICIQCSVKKYLNNNTCQDIPIENMIDNCQFYSSINDCSQCIEGYILNNNECMLSKIQNCLKYKNINQCEICQEGYGLFKENDSIICLTINKANCLQFKQTGNYPCIVCKQNYYPNDQGDCILSNPVIFGCQIQQSQSQCQKCEQGKILSQDQSKCENEDYIIQLVDSNCSNIQFLDNYRCSICQPGYILDKGNCVICSKQTFDQGCFYCNYQNQEQCLLCRDGYYMNKEGVCISQTQQNNIQEIQENNIYKLQLYIIIFILFI